jgi:selenocysteine-specific elongation factor
MHVVATAGHVDHGKSTVVRALTGMEPDRWAEERRRGLTIDLGFAWTDLPSGETVAFVDVPGHERFVPNMLAGVGPVPAAMVVVAADEGWMPQSAEHVAALDALGVRHGLLVVTRTDLADPAPATAQALARLADTSLGELEPVAVSAPTGAGLDQLRSALDRLVSRLPAPDTDAPVRLWIDRSFTIRGAGTVVTGTLGAGELRVGDELRLAGVPVRIRGLQSLGRNTDRVPAVARVAVNLRGVDRDRVRRGDALVTPGRFHQTDLVDVRVTGDPVDSLPPTVTLHIGSAAVTARIRPLGDDTARLRLSRPLPLHLGDRALLRDPGRHHVAGAAIVLDVTPPALDRRGAAVRRAGALADLDGRPDEAKEVRRRHLVRRGDLERMGIAVRSTPVAGDWLADPDWWSDQRKRLREHVDRYAADHPLQPAAQVEELRQALDLPDRRLVEALVTPPLVAADGRIGVPATGLPEAVSRAVRQVRADLAAHPFRAPEAARLAELGLGPRAIGAAVRAGALVRITDGIVLAPGAPDEAAGILRELSQPFTLSQARQALDTTRRVAVPLLEFLDREGLTRRLPDDRRTVAAPAGTTA